MTYQLAGKRVWVAGHRGMVGQALLRWLDRVDCETLTIDRAGLDLRRQAEVEAWMAAQRPQAVFLAAATVGGIQANASRPGEFIYDNMAITTHVIEAARRVGVEKLMFIGSSCAYPRLAEQPITEDALMGGPLEPTNEAYAIAKLAGMALCKAYRRQYGCDFVSVIPAGLYGPGDNLDPACNHVVPATIRKVLDAKAGGGAVDVWGTGAPLREFLHVDDAADAMVFLMERYSGEDVVNIGAGEVVSIRELVERVAAIERFTGPIRYDTTKPDGMPRKQLDSTRLLGMGWRPRTSLQDGLKTTCRWIADKTKVGADVL